MDKNILSFLLSHNKQKKTKLIINSFSIKARKTNCSRFVYLFAYIFLLFINPMSL